MNFVNTTLTNVKNLEKRMYKELFICINVAGVFLINRNAHMVQNTSKHSLNLIKALRQHINVYIISNMVLSIKHKLHIQ